MEENEYDMLRRLLALMSTIVEMGRDAPPPKGKQVEWHTAYGRLETYLRDNSPEYTVEIDAYLLASGRNPDLVGKWGKAIADAAQAKAERDSALLELARVKALLEQQKPLAAG